MPNLSRRDNVTLEEIRASLERIETRIASTK